jgi:hypothetical protein
MNNINDFFALITERAQLLEAFVKNEITTEKFQEELNRINNLLA